MSPRTFFPVGALLSTLPIVGCGDLDCDPETDPGCAPPSKKDCTELIGRNLAEVKERLGEEPDGDTLARWLDPTSSETPVRAEEYP